MQRKSIAGWTAIAVIGAALQFGLGGWAGRALMGPPIICQPIDIGDAGTIPEPSEKGTVPTIVKDTLEVLKTAKSVLVRMETLRRATLAVTRDEDQATDLLARLAWMAMDAAASDKPEWAATAYFDAAYLVACYDQMGVDVKWRPGVAENVNGYQWAKHALKLSGGNAEMEFGAALIVHPAMHRGMNDTYRKHLDEAAKKAAKGSLLEKNLKAHEEHWKDFVGK